MQMLLEAKLEKNGSFTVEYDEEGQEALIKAGIFSGLWKAIDSDKIGQLEQEVKRLKKLNRRLREKLNAK
jgi:hypothetical protein